MSTTDALPWTTARCNRLLRPISSRLVALKKLALREQAASAKSEEPTDEDTESPDPAQTRKVEDETLGSGSDVEQEGKDGTRDPDWVPLAAGRKGLKKKYSSRWAREAARQDGPRKRSVAKRTRLGEIAISTPMIARHALRGDIAGWAPPRPSISDEYAGGSRQEAEKKTNFKKKKKVDLVRRMAQSHSPDLYRQVRQLYDSVSHLLSATNPEEHTMDPEKGRSCGAKSLLSMCLRRVPDYMKLEQDWNDEHADEDIDSAAEIYAELEQLGTGEGWRHLRETVRAHGISLITEAIHGNILPEDCLLGLVRVVDRQGAFAETRHIITAWIQSSRPLAQPTSFDAELLPRHGIFDETAIGLMSAIHSHATDSKTWSFLCCQVTDMLLSHRLPIAWVATQSFMPEWNTAISAVSNADDPAHSDAVRFLQAVLMLGCGRTPADTGLLPANSEDEDSGLPVAAPSPGMREVLYNTIGSLTTILTSIALLHSAHPEEGDAAYEERGNGGAIHRLLEYVAQDLMQAAGSNDHQVTTSTPSTGVSRQCSILLSSLILSLSGSSFSASHNQTRISPLECIHAIESLANETTALQILPTFVCDIAKHCGRATKDDGFAQLKDMVDSLTGTSTHQSKTLRPSHTASYASWWTQRLAFDAALEWAGHTKDAAHLAYARQIEDTIQNTVTSFAATASPFKARGPGTSASVGERGSEGEVAQTNFRWEAGISEWVACTPAPARERRGLLKIRTRTRVASLPQRQRRWEQVLPEPSTSTTPVAAGQQPSDCAQDRELDQEMLALFSSPMVLPTPSRGPAFLQNPLPTPATTSSPAARTLYTQNRTTYVPAIRRVRRTSTEREKRKTLSLSTDTAATPEVRKERSRMRNADHRAFYQENAEGDSDASSTSTDPTESESEDSDDDEGEGEDELSFLSGIGPATAPKAGPQGGGVVSGRRVQGDAREVEAQRGAFGVGKKRALRPRALLPNGGDRKRARGEHGVAKKTAAEKIVDESEDELSFG